MRIAVQARLQPNLAAANSALLRLLGSVRHVFLVDDLRATDLPGYVRTPAQVTDGHLLAFAHRYGAQLATFDQGIPAAHRI